MNVPQFFQLFYLLLEVLFVGSHLPAGIARRYRTQVSHAGIARRYRTQVSPAGVARRRRPQVSHVGIARRCRTQVSHAGVARRYRPQVSHDIKRSDVGKNGDIESYLIWRVVQSNVNIFHYDSRKIDRPL